MGNGANGLRVWCDGVSRDITLNIFYCSKRQKVKTKVKQCRDVECFNHSISSSVNLVLENCQIYYIRVSENMVLNCITPYIFSYYRVFNYTSNNISVISWPSVSLVEETEVTGETTDLSQFTENSLSLNVA